MRSYAILPLLFVLGLGPAAAAVASYENFDYVAGNPLNKEKGGQGWNDAWAVVATANDAAIPNVGLAFGGLVVGGWMALTQPGSPS